MGTECLEHWLFCTFPLGSPGCAVGGLRGSQTLFLGLEGACWSSLGAPWRSQAPSGDCPRDPHCGSENAGGRRAAAGKSLAAAPDVPLPSVQPSRLSGAGTVGHAGAHALLPLCGGWRAEPGWAWATASRAGKFPEAQRGLRPQQQDGAVSGEVRAAAPRLPRPKAVEARRAVAPCVQTSSC